LVTAIDEIFYNAASQLVSNGDFLSAIITVLLTQVLWFFGAHGTETMFSLMPERVDVLSDVASGADPSMALSLADNASQVVQQSIFTDEFFSIFVSLGGAGCTMGLLIALFVVGSAGRGKKVAKISVFPSIFNINETLLYGAPIVLNPFFVLPFILAPMVTTAICYAAFATGLVPPIINAIYGSTPIFFSGYLGTGSIAGVILQLVCLAASFAVYAPFVLMNKNAYAREQELLSKELFIAAGEAADNEHQNLLTRRDALGEIARDFTAELHEYFDADQIPFRLVYQPKSDKDGRVVGAEALLRWQHPRFGPVSPVALIELTDEAGLTTQLGRWITNMAFAEFATWKHRGITDVLLSLNLNPMHIYEDPEFPQYVAELIGKYGIDASEVEMEITEHVAVHSSSAMFKMFEQLRALNIGLSIDDMGMGYSSLTYISDFGVGTVKIDISLVDKVTQNVQQQEIVSSVVELARQLDLAVIVEGVEEKDQLDALVKLGCNYFQGYYFSKPLEKEDFVKYVQEKGTAKLRYGI
jgi:EAL domain-containing protein (putative c-di-GMP-specific phosphodiesterase class I)